MVRRRQYLVTRIPGYATVEVYHALVRARSMEEAVRVAQPDLEKDALVLADSNEPNACGFLDRSTSDYYEVIRVSMIPNKFNEI